MGLFFSRRHLHGENNGLQQSVVCILYGLFQLQSLLDQILAHNDYPLLIVTDDVKA